MSRASAIVGLAVLLGATGAMAQGDPRTPEVIAALGHELGPKGFSADARYGIAFADLNDDHQAEALVHLVDPGYCGSGGCTTFVLTQSEGAWHSIGRMTVSQLPIYRLPSHHDGWFDLAVRLSGGGVQPGMRAISFARGHYTANTTKAPVLARVPQEASLLLGVTSVEYAIGQ
jgi:hypothetical protein